MLGEEPLCIPPSPYLHLCLEILHPPWWCGWLSVLPLRASPPFISGCHFLSTTEGHCSNNYPLYPLSSIFFFFLLTLDLSHWQSSTLPVIRRILKIIPSIPHSFQVLCLPTPFHCCLLWKTPERSSSFATQIVIHQQHQYHLGIWKKYKLICFTHTYWIRNSTLAVSLGFTITLKLGQHWSVVMIFNSPYIFLLNPL